MGYWNEVALTVIVEVMRLLYNEVSFLKIFCKYYKGRFHITQQCSAKLTKIPLCLTSILSFEDKHPCQLSAVLKVAKCVLVFTCLFYQSVIPLPV